MAKTGWSYIEISAKQAQQLKNLEPRLAIRVKGKLMAFPIKQVSLLPMGEGTLSFRSMQPCGRGTGKSMVAQITVQFEEDKAAFRSLPILWRG